MSDRRRFDTAFDGEGRSSRLATAVFGDRVGLAIFLAALLVFTVLWIVTWRINDSLTLLNTLAGMGDGHLHITAVKYGSHVGTPGTHEIGGEVFGRNYGILALSLVPLAIFDALAIVADLRIAIAGAFSLLVLALALVVGRLLDRRRRAAWIGGALALVLFVANVAVATDLDQASTELYAIQVTHMIAAAFVVVFAYRLVAEIHDRPTGIFAAGLVGLATPVGLWATIPKRHVIAPAIALVLALALYRSRKLEAEEPGSGRAYRAGGYALIGLFAWVHAPEALVLLVVFAAVDLPTASRDVRSLATIAVALGLATIPFLVTNYLLSGSPVRPPRMLPDAGASTGEPTFGGGGGGGGAGGGGLIGTILGTVDPVMRPFTVLLDLFAQSLANVVYRPGDVLGALVRSGYLGGWHGEQANYESVNLAVLESAPVLAATLGVIPAISRRIRRNTVDALSWPPSPARTVDAFLVLFTVAFSLTYLSRFPIHAQITVRYLLPIFPALVVLVVRLSAVRNLVAAHWRALVWTYAAAVLVGGQLLVVALVFADPGVGEAFQFHAWIGLAIAAPLGIWSLVGRADGWWGRAGAVLFGLGAGAVTVFLLMLTLDYFSVGNSQALPVVRLLGEIVSIV